MSFQETEEMIFKGRKVEGNLSTRKGGCNSFVPHPLNVNLVMFLYANR